MLFQSAENISRSFYERGILWRLVGRTTTLPPGLSFLTEVVCWLCKCLMSHLSTWHPISSPSPSHKNSHSLWGYCPYNTVNTKTAPPPRNVRIRFFSTSHTNPSFRVSRLDLRGKTGMALSCFWQIPGFCASGSRIHCFMLPLLPSLILECFQVENCGFCGNRTSSRPTVLQGHSTLWWRHYL
jgi:hypothetical protein